MIVRTKRIMEMNSEVDVMMKELCQGSGACRRGHGWRRGDDMLAILPRWGGAWRPVGEGVALGPGHHGRDFVGFDYGDDGDEHDDHALDDEDSDDFDRDGEEDEEKGDFTERLDEAWECGR